MEGRLVAQRHRSGARQARGFDLRGAGCPGRHSATGQDMVPSAADRAGGVGGVRGASDTVGEFAWRTLVPVQEPRGIILDTCRAGPLGW